MGLFRSWIERSRERRHYFDEDLDKDLWDLLEASALLEIKEFALFELAYKDWYGRRPLPRVIETHFTNYMFHGVIPAWVHHYARNVVELHKRGELEPRRLGIYQPLPSRKLMAIGKLYTAALLVTLLVLTVFAYRDTAVMQSLFGRADDPPARLEHPLDRPRHNAIP